MTWCCGQFTASTKDTEKQLIFNEKFAMEMRRLHT